MTALTSLPKLDWPSLNQQLLMERLGEVRTLLTERASQGETPGNEIPPVAQTSVVESPGEDQAQSSALDILSRRFGLSGFEQELLLLCAGMELDGRWAALCEKAHGRAYPTLSLALSLLPGANWGAIAPSAPLRRWQLIELSQAEALTQRPLRIDERILHYLTGLQQWDERLLKMLSPIPAAPLLTKSHETIVSQILGAWRQNSTELSLPPVIQLVGEDSLSKNGVAAAATQQAGLQLMELAGAAIPTDWGELSLLKILCEREASLGNLALLLDWETLGPRDGPRAAAAAELVDTTYCYLMVSSRDRQATRGRSQLTHEIQLPSLIEQRQLWRTGLESHFAEQIDPIVAQFHLGAAAIQSACLQANSQLQEHLQSHRQTTASNQAELPTAEQLLWSICRNQARPRLDELAQRIPASATWQDLVLPDKERQILQELAAHVKHRTQIYADWGFGGKSQRGLGISALFCGASGTGKTTAAEVIADELALDVYRIDLSAVVSKYIGETEKNLRRIFDAAESGGAILLFDEADALFGKRSDVQDSKDRYANMEVSYLLQRMESYRGLAILTTNLKNAMDQAFLRRIRFVVQFPFPDLKQRAEIWRRIFPAATPTEDLAYEKLAKLNIAGGNIRNIAVNAAFLAADAGQSVQMQHLLQAAQREYLKLERPLTESEVRGWV